MKYQSTRLITLTSLLVLFSSVGAMAIPNLISDGGFEDPVICPTPFQTFSNGNNIGAWLVGGDSVDLTCITLWEPNSGIQSLDLNGSDTGSVCQDIDTIPGAIYRLTFALAGNPDNNQPDPLDNNKTLDVFAGSTVNSYVFNTTNQTNADMGWVNKGFFFTASGLVTTLCFESTTPGAFGPVIDDVVVTLRCPPLAISDVNDPNFDIECL